MKMNDLISRQAAYDTLAEYYHHTTETQQKSLKEALNRVPTISTDMATLLAYESGKRDVKQKHGKWINDEGLYRCSVCNNLWTHWWIAACPENRMYKEMKFCPNCGAKMDRS